MTCAFNREGKKSYLVRGKVYPARRNNPRIKAAEAPMRQGRPEPPSDPPRLKVGVGRLQWKRRRLRGKSNVQQGGKVGREKSHEEAFNFLYL